MRDGRNCGWEVETNSPNYVFSEKIVNGLCNSLRGGNLTRGVGQT